jgi:hypothetical protein
MHYLFLFWFLSPLFTLSLLLIPPFAPLSHPHLFHFFPLFLLPLFPVSTLFSLYPSHLSPLSLHPSLPAGWCAQSRASRGVQHGVRAGGPNARGSLHQSRWDLWPLYSLLTGSMCDQHFRIVLLLPSFIVVLLFYETSFVCAHDMKYSLHHFGLL